MNVSFRGRLFKIWYWYINSADKNAEVMFMNYGYSNPEEQLDLREMDRPNRYSIQLYHHTASGVDLKNKDIIEIGCGRGGGLSYVTRQFSPSSALGIDLDKGAADFCARHYKQQTLSFSRGDAQNVPATRDTFDVVLSVESSHRYQEMKVFLEEVRRVLRPGGYFLFTDFRFDYEMSELKEQLQSCNMRILKEEMITSNVIDALEKDDDRRRRLVRGLAPWFLRGLALDFAGAVDSTTYRRFVTEKYMYFNYIMQKS